MAENENEESDSVMEVLKDPESIDRSVRSIRHYSMPLEGASERQIDRVSSVDHLAERVADKAESLELSNVMSDDELEKVEEVVELAVWSSLVNMRLISEEVMKNNDND